MDQWGPYLAEKAAGLADSASEVASPEFCNRDGLFGFCNSAGTAGAAISVWTSAAQVGQPKERLQLQQRDGGVSCVMIPGLVDPLYRYCTCKCRCHQAGGPAFNIQFELAKEHANRIYYRVTVERRVKAPDEASGATELTVAAQLWVCHPDCGRVQLAEAGEVDRGGGGGGGRHVRLRMADGCRGQACVHLPSNRLESGNTDLLSEESRRVENLKLCYPPEHLDSVVFCAEPQSLDRLIVHNDASLLCSNQTVGCRVALVYKLQLPAVVGSCVSLCLLLTEAGDPGPDSPAGISRLMSRAATLASAALTPSAADGGEVDHQTGGVIRRALSSLLWNRQLCTSSGESIGELAAATSSSSVELSGMPGPPFLTMVPDKWSRPGLCGWEHGVHAIALCRVSSDLAMTELRQQLARMSVSGEILSSQGGTEPPVWPLALLEILRHHTDTEAANVTFCDLLRHLHWWLLMRRDACHRSTLDGGVLGLRHAGWMDAVEHDGESNDSLVWSGFFCAKMVHLAALLRRQELKSLMDLFNASVSSLHNEAAFVNGLFRPNLLGSAAEVPPQPAGTSPRCKRAAQCCCTFGLVPLLGCALVPQAGLADDPEAQTLVDWLHWLSSESSSSSDTPCLFVRGEETHGRVLISWLGEAEFLQTCQLLFDPVHFLGPHGLRCTSHLLSKEARDDDSDSSNDTRCRPVRRASIVSLPWNYLVLESLKCWESVYGQQLQLDYPTGSGVQHSLNDIIVDISQRLMSIFAKFSEDSQMLREFYEATSGRGIGGHRTGWSGVIANIAENLTRQPTLAVHKAPPLPRTVGHILPRNSVVNGFRENLRCSIKMEDFAPETSFDWDNDEI